MLKISFPKRKASGFSLVELLVATVITLLGLLVITRVFMDYEQWKRTTIGSAQTQEGGLLGAFSIEKDLRIAGLGMIGLRCLNSTINAHNDNAATPDFTLNAMPATITQDSPAAGSDTINIMYSTSPFANIAATIQSDMPSSSSVLQVDKGIGFNNGDLLVISQPTKRCAIVQLTKDGQPSGKANVTGPGTSWDLEHNDAAVWNPPTFPAGGYTTGAKILNLGQPINHSFYVQNNMLRMDELNLLNASMTSYDLIPGVVGLRARYGRDTDNDGVLDLFDNDTVALKAAFEAGSSPLDAIQFSLIVRSGNWEKDQVSPATIAYWPGGPTLALSADDRHYRYRVFQTIVPLKNIIWNN